MNNKNYESVEERIRNSVGAFYNHVAFIKNLKEFRNDPEKFDKILDIIIKDNDHMLNSINYLIQIGNAVDKYLPEDFSINEIIDKTKIYK